MGKPAVEPEDDEPGIFDIPDEAADEASTLRGLADFEAGRVVSHEAVSRWLLSLGSDNPLPRPKCGE
ncbi:MAG: CopG family transcriptional regulator [Brevundimonas sp.]|uniref:CopG family transcriptional regulator n=1 Tax=Brevundimonas sp. TaxID=1871086 RepID=UPI00273428F2|nr:CopG family transcriptional regulator [Brevundimonas sp.]MDP3404323.1 CopG family transcriptional regulator [Brevundimonas sp.]